MIKKENIISTAKGFFVRLIHLLYQIVKFKKDLGINIIIHGIEVAADARE